MYNIVTTTNTPPRQCEDCWSRHALRKGLRGSGSSAPVAASVVLLFLCFGKFRISLGLQDKAKPQRERIEQRRVNFEVAPGVQKTTGGVQQRQGFARQGSKEKLVYSDKLVITVSEKTVRVCNNFQYGLFITQLPLLVRPLSLDRRAALPCVWPRELGVGILACLVYAFPHDPCNCTSCRGRNPFLRSRAPHTQSTGTRKSTSLTLFSFLIFFFSESVSLSGSFLRSSLPIVR